MRHFTILVYIMSSLAMTEINMLTSSPIILELVILICKIMFLNKTLKFLFSGGESNFQKRSKNFMDENTKYNIYSMYVGEH